MEANWKQITGSAYSILWHRCFAALVLTCAGLYWPTKAVQCALISAPITLCTYLHMSPE